MDTTMRIMFVGDINLGEYYTAFGHGPRTYLQKHDIFDGVRNVLSKADLVVGNLEAPMTNQEFDPSSVESSVLRGDPEHAWRLAEAGFKVLQVANNHSVQHGQGGFSETVSLLKDLEIAPIGLRDQELTKLTAGNQTIGFFSASDVPDNTDKTQQCYQRLNGEFLERVGRAVASVDHLFLMLHWGLEASTKPLSYQKDIIKDLANIGLRGIIGAHPHLFYEVWRENKNTIAAPSLGNFVFDLFWDERLLKTGILDIELTKSAIKNCQVWPVNICKESGRPISSGTPVQVQCQAPLTLYNLGDNMRGEQLRKLHVFFKDLSKGNTWLKLKFIRNKFLRIKR